MSYGGSWNTDPDTLEEAVRRWAQQHHPSIRERNAVEAFVRRLRDGPYLGAQDPDDRTVFRGRVPDTNLVVVHVAEFTYRRIYVSEIVAS